MFFQKKWPPPVAKRKRCDYVGSAMKKLPRISDTEWEIIKVVWKKSPVNAAEIIADLQDGDDWHPKTAKTLLNRLVRKGALGFDKSGRSYLYKPKVSEKDAVKAATKAFLHRVFDGDVKRATAEIKAAAGGR